MSPLIMEERSPGDKHRRDLDAELRLDASDLRSHGWYHGPIPRAHAQKLLRTEGQFLVRDSISDPGGYVLSIFASGHCLNFKINKVMESFPGTNYIKTEYHFEGARHPTVAALIMAHVGQTPPKFITEKSRAAITTPVNRTMPITFYAEKYGALHGGGASAKLTQHGGAVSSSNGGVVVVGVTRTPSTPLSSSPQKWTPTNSPTQQRKFPTRRGSDSSATLHRQYSAPSPTQQPSQQPTFPVTKLTPATPNDFPQRHKLRNAQASDSGIFVEVQQQQQQQQQQQPPVTREEALHLRLQQQPQQKQTQQRSKFPRRTGSEDGLLTVAVPDVVNGNFHSSSSSSPSSPAGGTIGSRPSARSSPSSPTSFSPRSSHSLPLRTKTTEAAAATTGRAAAKLSRTSFDNRPLHTNSLAAKTAETSAAVTSAASSSTTAPPPKPSRVPTFRKKSSRPVIQIRDANKYNEEDIYGDYSLYAHVRRPPRQNDDDEDEDDDVLIVDDNKNDESSSSSSTSSVVLAGRSKTLSSSSSKLVSSKLISGGAGDKVVKTTAHRESGSSDEGIGISPSPPDPQSPTSSSLSSPIDGVVGGEEEGEPSTSTRSDGSIERGMRTLELKDDSSTSNARMGDDHSDDPRRSRRGSSNSSASAASSSSSSATSSSLSSPSAATTLPMSKSRLLLLKSPPSPPPSAAESPPPPLQPRAVTSPTPPHIPKYTGVKKVRAASSSSSSSTSTLVQPPSPAAMIPSNDDCNKQRLFQQRRHYSSSSSLPSKRNPSISSVSSSPYPLVFTSVDEDRYSVGDGGEEYARPDYADCDAGAQDDRVITLPSTTTTSTTLSNPVAFATSIMPADVKLLDEDVIKAVKRHLLSGEVTPTQLAMHLTKVDIEHLKLTRGHDLGVGVSNGLELLTLPQGKALRKDVIERFSCLQFFVAIMLLKGCDNHLDRSKMLKVWIEIARELREKVGNLNSYVAIVQALASNEIRQITEMWELLRRQDTTSAFYFESRLLPSLKCVTSRQNNIGNEDTCIPYLIPLITWLERDPSTPFIHDPWEESEADLGLDLLWDTLETSRLLMADIPKFAAKAGALNNSFMVVGEVLDIFRTEFLMKLLYGSKGCVSSSNERTNKFKQLIRIYSGRIALEK